MSTFIVGLPSRLHSSRINAELSLREASSRVGISYNSICAYELGTRTPSAMVLCKLAVTYNVSTDYLLGIDKVNKAVLNSNGLTKEQIEVIQNLIKVMKK